MITIYILLPIGLLLAAIYYIYNGITGFKQDNEVASKNLLIGGALYVIGGFIHSSVIKDMIDGCIQKGVDTNQYVDCTEIIFGNIFYLIVNMLYYPFLIDVINSYGAN